MWEKFFYEITIMSKVADVSVIPDKEIWPLSPVNQITSKGLFYWDRKLKYNAEPREMDIGINNKRELFYYRKGNWLKI